MTKLYSGTGHPVALGQMLGRGGEGAVHEILDRPGFVAKIYHQPVSADKALKLDGMARRAHSKLLEIAAWPVDVLRVHPNSPVQGFVMPKVSGYREIHGLYGPAHRKKTFPQADWSFLIHAARNLASAFETIHARGHVIGDVNPGNVVVSAQALVKLIDCDSFQIDTGKRLFPCDVGVPQFTAPELQDRSFHGLRRTPNHDNFGLALLCFHLLFMGRHPFAGRYHGKGDMPIERAIKECRFAFSQHAASHLMEAPPHTLPLATLPQPVAQLFERAFAPPHSNRSRPTAREWLLALEGLNSELRLCQRSTVHKYPRQAPSCPWCALEQASGTLFFIAPTHPLAAGATAHFADFDLESAWRRIKALEPPPEKAPLAAATAQATPITPTPLPESLRQIRRYNMSKAAAIASIALLAILIRPKLSWLWLPLAVVGWSLSRDNAVQREYQRRRLALFAARRELNDLRAAWQRSASTQAFAEKLHALRQLREQYRALADEFQRGLQRLEADQRQFQLQVFLEGHFVDAARIPSLRATDRMALESYGIETAADVTPTAIQVVPGFGQRFGQERYEALLAWRQALERQFRYNPDKGANPAALANLRQHYAQQRQRIERGLLAGPEELAKIKTDILKQRGQLDIALIHQSMREAQAQADLRVFYPDIGIFRRYLGG